MVDPQLAEACRIQAEHAELGPALTLLQKRGKLGATLVALAQALGISQSQLQEPVAATGVSQARALAHRLADAKVECRQHGMEPAIYFAPPAREPPRPGPPKPAAAVSPRSVPLKPAPPVVVRSDPPKAPPPEPRAPRPRLSLNVSLAVERDRNGQLVVSNVRLTGPDAADYEIIAQAQDEVNSADGVLRSVGLIVELEHR